MDAKDNSEFEREITLSIRTQADALALTKQFGLSHRQFHRYFKRAQNMVSPITEDKPNMPIRIKLPADVAARLRAFPLQ